MFERLKAKGISIIGDEATMAVVLDQFVNSKGSLKVGYFYFIDGLRQPDISFTTNYYLLARAICILEINGEYYAHVAEFTLSNLISSLSNIVHRGVTMKASKLYGSPKDTSDNEEWNKLKFEYLKNRVIVSITAILGHPKRSMLGQFLAQ